jgi:hypothetical protein
METAKKESYVAAAIFLVVGIIFFVTGLDQGWSSGKITIIIGFILGGFGGLGLWKPEIGEVIAHYLKGLGGEKSTVTQKQNRPKNSPQVNGKNVKFTQNFYGNTK